jgi:hypothetical protein
MTRALLFVLAAAGCSASPKQQSTGEPAATGTPSPAEGTPAQIPAPGTDPCPAMQVKAPDSVPAGTQVKITTTQVGGTTPTFKWTVSAGKIASGQGTANIVVDSTGLAGSTIVASLELGGLPSTCATTGTSVNVLVGP